MIPHHSGKSVSYWSANENLPVFDPLARDVRTEVCVVGGGFSGLMTAYLLMKEGKRVCLLEGFELANGQTSRSLGHISNALGIRFFELEKYHGSHGPMMTSESHREAIQKIEDIVTSEKIECGFEYLNGYLFACDQESNQIIDQEFETCLRAGMTEVKSVESVPIHDFPVQSALVFPRQAQFNPLKFLKKIVELLKAGGVEIYGGSLQSITSYLAGLAKILARKFQCGRTVPRLVNTKVCRRFR